MGIIDSVEADYIRDDESARRIQERTELSTAAIHSAGPAASILTYDEFEENERLTCPQCGWRGQAKEGQRELHAELFDVSCPTCEKMLLVVSL